MNPDAAMPLTLTRGAIAVAAACCCVAAALAVAVSGARAAAAVIVGAAAMGLAVSCLTRLLRALIEGPRRGAGPRLRALVGAAIRWPLMATAVGVALWAGMSGPWLALGVTAWPVALIVDGLTLGRRTGVAVNQA